MADLINASDPLNQGRVKINKAIEQSERAEGKSDKAVEDSAVAKTTAELVQTQFDEVVSEGTIDPAVEQMKVDSNGAVHPSPDARLRFEYGKTTAQLAQTNETLAINVKFFGVIGDGETDDTIALQKAIDTGRKIIIPNGEYLFDKVTLTRNGTHIIFGDKVILKSAYADDLKTVGSFEIKGSDLNTMPITATIKKNSNFFTVADVSTFKVGDFVKITQTNPVGSTPDIHKQKFLNFVSIVKSIDALTKTIYTMGVNPHRFEFGNAPFVTRVEAVRNIKIEGDNTLFDKMGTTTYTDHFYVYNGHDINISGFDCANGGGKGVGLYFVDTYDVRDIEHTKSTNNNAGHGYGVQVSHGSTNGLIEKITSKEGRHAVDFAEGASHCLVRDSNGFESDLFLHGMNSKHIRFENCNTYGSSMGVGNDTFLSDENITFFNCTSFRSNNSGFFARPYCKSIKFIDCLVVNNNPDYPAYDVLENSEDVTLDNCDTENTFDFITYLALSIKGKNVKVTSSSFNHTNILIGNGARDVELKNTSVYNSAEKNTTMTHLRIEGDAKDVTLDGFSCKGYGSFGLDVADTASNITIIGIDADLVNSQRVINIASTARNVDIINAKRIKTSKTGAHVLFSSATRLRLINSNLEGGIIQIEAGLELGLYVQNNHFSNVGLDIRNLKNILLTGNSGKIIYTKVPVTDVANNVTVTGNAYTN